MISEKIINVLGKFKDKDVWLAIGLILLSLFILFLAFYSYGPIDDSNVISLETSIGNIKSHSNSKKSIVTFTSETGQRFYCRADQLSVGSGSVLADLLNDIYRDQTVKVSYTTRRDLLPINAMEFSGYDRVVSIETETEQMITIEDYNNANRGFFVAFLVVALVVFVFGVIFFRWCF